MFCSFSPPRFSQVVISCIEGVEPCTVQENQDVFPRQSNSSWQAVSIRPSFSWICSATLLTAFITAVEDARGIYGACCPVVTCSLCVLLPCFQSSPISLFSGPSQDISRWHDIITGDVGPLDTSHLCFTWSWLDSHLFPPDTWVQASSISVPAPARLAHTFSTWVARFCGLARVWPRHDFLRKPCCTW